MDKLMYKHFKKKKILLIEDEHLTRAMMSRHLSFFNENEIDTAVNCKIGYELFKQNDYDLIITDFLTPVMTCEKLVPLIRKENSQIPIFILSADIYESHKDFVSQYKINGYFEKPYKASDLIRNINDFFNNECSA